MFRRSHGRRGVGPRMLSVLVVAGAWSACTRSPATPTGASTRDSEQTGAATMKVIIASTAFDAGQRIPTQHTGEGPDVSPALTWTGVPQNTAELALIMDDPDAPTPEPWIHWVLAKIPPGVTGLREGIPRDEKLNDPAGAIQGKNSWNTVGYRGPLPPPGHGTHHYHFKLYALDQPLSLQPGLTKKQLLDAMRGHILAEGELVGTYSR